MQSAFGGEYPGAGGQLGPAMAFAYLAIAHIVGTAPARGSDFASAAPGGRDGSNL